MSYSYVWCNAKIVNLWMGASSDTLSSVSGGSQKRPIHTCSIYAFAPYKIHTHKTNNKWEFLQLLTLYRNETEHCIKWNKRDLLFDDCQLKISGESTHSMTLMKRNNFLPFVCSDAVAASNRPFKTFIPFQNCQFEWMVSFGMFTFRFEHFKNWNNCISRFFRFILNLFCFVSHLSLA